MRTSDNSRAARDSGTRDAMLEIAFAFWRATLLLSGNRMRAEITAILAAAETRD